MVHHLGAQSEYGFGFFGEALCRYGQGSVAVFVGDSSMGCRRRAQFI